VHVLSRGTGAAVAATAGDPHAQCQPRTGRHLARSRDHHMRHRAQLQNDGQLVLLALVVVTTVASLAAIVGELTVVKDAHGFLKTAHAALAGVTVLSSWTFIQVMFALHDAYNYYGAVCHGRAAPLQFPDAGSPDYGDFFYFAAIIGTSGQTADVSFVSKPMRRIGPLHCILSYLFNTTVLALLITRRARCVLTSGFSCCRCLCQRLHARL
jgi:uncharacterized membrane protein